MNLLIILSMFLFHSCKSGEEKLQCLESKTQDWSKEQVYSDIRNGLNSTLQGWIDDSVKAVQYYKLSVWQVDETVFFNSSKDAAVLLVLNQDTSKNATMDNIQLIFARKQNQLWQFYCKSMNTIMAQRYYSKENPEVPYTFKELSDIGKKKILEGGYLKTNCEINDHYINDWYTERLEEMHQEFLNNK